MFPQQLRTFPSNVDSLRGYNFDARSGTYYYEVEPCISHYNIGVFQNFICNFCFVLCDINDWKTVVAIVVFRET